MVSAFLILKYKDIHYYSFTENNGDIKYLGEQLSNLVNSSDYVEWGKSLENSTNKMTFKMLLNLELFDKEIQTSSHFLDMSSYNGLGYIINIDLSHFQIFKNDYDFIKSFPMYKTINIRI